MNKIQINNYQLDKRNHAGRRSSRRRDAILHNNSIVEIGHAPTYPCAGCMPVCTYIRIFLSTV